MLSPDHDRVVRRARRRRRRSRCSACCATACRPPRAGHVVRRRHHQPREGRGRVDRAPARAGVRARLRAAARSTTRSTAAASRGDRPRRRRHRRRARRASSSCTTARVTCGARPRRRRRYQLRVRTRPTPAPRFDDAPTTRCSSRRDRARAMRSPPRGARSATCRTTWSCTPRRRTPSRSTGTSRSSRGSGARRLRAGHRHLREHGRRPSRRPSSLAGTPRELTIHVCTTIAAPPDAVWRAVEHIETHTEWMPDAEPHHVPQRAAQRRRRRVRLPAHASGRSPPPTGSW